MQDFGLPAQRRMVLAGLAATLVSAPLAGPARAAGLGRSLNDMLGRASDSALARLAQLGAFYNDAGVRIGLPLIGGSGGLMGSVMKAGRNLGVLDGLTRKLNDAAGSAAGLAKPIFHTAIDKLSLGDVPGIVSQRDGATQYLRTSAGTELHGRLRPLVDTALGDLGAFKQLDKLSGRSDLLSAAGISRDGLGKSVTSQALTGIFKYIAGEEEGLRANPLGKAGSLLDGILKN